MKRFLTIALLALTTNVNAETVMVSKNKAGGEIQLTDEVCRLMPKDYLRVYAYGQSGEMLEGCWAYVDGDTVVRVVWIKANGRDVPMESRMYPLSGFSITAAGYRWANR